MKKLLIITDWFTPAFKAGGPVRSIHNLVHLLKAEVEIYVLTGDRDLGEEEAFQNIQTNTWIQFDKNIQVKYLTPPFQNRDEIFKIIQEVGPDTLYLNSMYSKVFTLIPLTLLKKLPPSLNVVLCPRGMLKASAVKFKYLKKKAFLIGLKWSGLSKKVKFHATDEQEKKDILKWFGNDSKIEVVSNIPKSGKYISINKDKGILNLLFVGRIHPIKNLIFVFEVLMQVKANVNLDIIANLEDESYWSECQKYINDLPENIVVNFLGPQPHSTIEKEIEKSHLFFLPTKGENFGHAIFESLATGRPVLISDQTPWRGLEAKNAGWDLPLNDQKAFVSEIEKMAVMDQNSYDEMCKSAHKMAENYVHSQNFVEQYKGLFSA